MQTEFQIAAHQKRTKRKESGIHRNVVGSLISSKSYTVRGDRHKNAESKGKKRQRKRFCEHEKNTLHDNGEERGRKKGHFGVLWLWQNVGNKTKIQRTTAKPIGSTKSKDFA